MEITVVVVLLRRTIAPLLLAKLSERLRARSISMRSIRGLYVKSRERTWRIERISWSLSVFSQKHISIKVTGLSLELTPFAAKVRRPTVDRRFPRRSMRAVQVFESLSQLIYALFPFRMNTAIKRFIASFCRRALVALVQTLNFELDTVVLSSSDFPGTEVVISNVAFNSMIDFSYLDKKEETPCPTRVRPNKRFSAMAAARDVFSSKKGVAVSLTIDIHGITGRSLTHSYFSSDESRVYELPIVDGDDVFLRVPGVTQFKLGFSYDPLIHELAQSTVETSLFVPRCDIFLDKFRSALHSASNDHDDTLDPLHSNAKLLDNTHDYISSLLLLNIQVGSINLFHRNSFNIVHLLATEDLHVTLWPSDGLSSSLHKKWLGSGDQGLTLGFTVRINGIQLSRFPSESAEMIQCIIALNRINIDAIFHKWPMQYVALSRPLDNIDEPLIVGEIIFGSVIITDQLRLLLATLATFGTKEVASSSTKNIYPAIMFPNARFDAACQTLTIDLFDGEHISSSESTYSLVTSDIAIHLDMAPHDHRSSCMGTNHHTFLKINSCLSHGPIHVYYYLKDNDLDALHGAEPLITIDQMSGCFTYSIATTYSYSIPSELITLHPNGSVLYVKFFVDNMLLNLWRRDNLLLLRSLERMFGSFKNDTSRTSRPSFNYVVHVGIYHATFSITGLDLNPSCELGLSRGLEFDGGFTLKIFNSEDNSRNIKELLLSSTSPWIDQGPSNPSRFIISNDCGINLPSSDASSKSFISCTLQDFTCSSITATSFEYGRNQCSTNSTHSSLLAIPGLYVDVSLSHDLDTMLIRVNNSSAPIRTYIDFLGAYSALLVFQTLQKCFKHEVESRDTSRSMSMSIDFNIQFTALDVRCSLPLTQQISFGIEGVIINNSPTSLLSMVATSMTAYVPASSLSESRKQECWDLLLKLSDTSFDVSRGTRYSCAVAVEGLHFSIPHGFIFSELLTSLTIAIKALRHLLFIVQEGHHIHFPAPTAEKAKKLPEIVLRIKCLVLELLDNPFDGKIGRISRIGPKAQRLRAERERAFKAKVRNLHMEDETGSDDDLQDEYPYMFTSKRTVSVSDAKDRLNQVHALSWFKAICHEEERMFLLEGNVSKALNQVQNTSLLSVLVHQPDKLPPLFRAMLNGLDLRISPFHKEKIQSDILSELGSMPKSTQYTLLVPFHMECALDGARMFIRDYPLPLFNIPTSSDKPGLEVETDIVIAEELGLPESVEWFACPVVPNESGFTGCEGYFLNVPKTIMPVKSYANLHLRFHSAVTEFTWGISYSPAIQDILRIVETLTPTSVDPSPAIGFWDKLRLVLHWRIKAIFDGMVCLHFKVDLSHPSSKSLLSLQENVQKGITDQWSPNIIWCPDGFEKLCAEFSNGIKWGIGFVLERTSNFIHLSTSLISPLKDCSDRVENAFHLTPKTFAHFWSWWGLFDDGISLPIRQGRVFPGFRLPTQKFSQHLATVKYRIEFSSIYIAHTYKLDTAEGWKQGITRCVGIKTFLESFQADLHQRLEEKARSRNQKQKSKVIRHRPFYAIDVILTGLDLRSLMAKFVDPDKRLVNPNFTANSTNFWDTLTPCSSTSEWIDLDDFTETDWQIPEADPTIYLYETAFCPRFVYFKRLPLDSMLSSNTNKFGDEATHVCLMGKEPSVQQVQLQFGIKRLLDLRMQAIAREQNIYNEHILDDITEKNTRQMMGLLEDYVQHSSASLSRPPNDPTDYIPTSIVLPEEIRHFANVYQVHCPIIHLSYATRDILREYYVASRARRGFEYHLSARAVKFIRDQEPAVSTEVTYDSPMNSRQGNAHLAAKAVRKILSGEGREDPDTSKGRDSLLGWEHGISEYKAHLCLLLKPQVVLQSNHPQDFTLLLAADHVVLRNHGIVDDANVEDHVSGLIMQRQASPNPASTTHLPFEVFLDIRCESHEFKRIVPQTHATLRYDKFNKLRLRNNVTTLSSTLKQDKGAMDHLMYEMDLLEIEVPRFSVAADASAFAAMSSIVNDLLLFSDPARKGQSLQLETMIFGYDFTNYHSAAKVVSDLQSRLKWRIHLDEFYRTRQYESVPVKNMLENKAYILKLSEELNMVLDAFKLAQIKTDDRSHDKKSALRLHTASSEVSWRMLGGNRELLAKLAVRGIDFSWLSRQDSSTTSVLEVEDLQAFDGSPSAIWPEILTKYNEPINHHMVKRGLFMKGQWSVLAPVGGISIYNDFKIELHPIRLTLETQLGNKILAYILPGRGSQMDSSSDHLDDVTIITENVDQTTSSSRPKRHLLTSRSLSNLTLGDLEPIRRDYHAPGLPKSQSSTALVAVNVNTADNEEARTIHMANIFKDKDGDVYQMSYRSNQKTFVHAEIPSVHVLLSIIKGKGFLIRDARLRTHDLEWRNRTSSLEELIEHFVPSDPSWKGWVKVAWQQPIFSVGGVVKELITKTQWGRIGKQIEDEKKPKST
ncbi:hypothetical protein Clacol_001610 [Clathrus columnatus]|uniref:Vacuolar protein sorting-associated protein 13D n=1 Tax=Clathrus columnatus TaxID=1419009 RepID=A0AAV5A424_9AGAM|nr:hypothetical protein Clacol_001610 [Clathrus columnatus]